MRIGLVGYQGSGKSSLFELLTGVAADPSLAHTSQSAMAAVPDPRLEHLSAIYTPKKTTPAALEIVDTPGLSRTHEGNPARLALIREAGCLVVVVAAFDSADPTADINSFEQDLLLADLEVMSGRAERLRESIKKPRPNRQEQQAQLAAIEPLVALLEEGRPLGEHPMSDEQLRATRAFQLLTEKPRAAIINLADDQHEAARTEQQRSADRMRIIAVPIGLELELARMSPGEAAEFRREMGIGGFDRDQLLRTLASIAGQTLFFTVGPKEVRAWMISRGATALEAAETIHSDMARGFIRAEVMTCDDLVLLGSEREVKQQHLVRQEPKDYVVQDGDVLLIRFSV